jgi:hypothetical protein
MALLLYKGISEEETQRLLTYLHGEKDRLVQSQVLMLLANQPNPSASVIVFFKQLVLNGQVTDQTTTLLFLYCLIRNGIAENIASIRHIIVSSPDPGQSHIAALHYARSISLNTLNRLLNDKDIIDTLPPSAWDYLTYLHTQAAA